MRTTILSAVSTLALLLVPAAVSAQACGIVPGVSLSGGYASYRVSGGTSGVTVGADVAIEATSLGVQLAYRRVMLDGETADPDVVRAAVTYPVIRLAGIDLCAVGHGGVARFSFEGDAGAVMAGGIGATLAPSMAGPVQPFLSVRGLGARTTGTVLGLEIDASGLSFGAEAGIALLFGPAAIRVSGTLDGFDDGLGITPYPGHSAELAVQLRF